MKRLILTIAALATTAILSADAPSVAANEKARDKGQTTVGYKGYGARNTRVNVYARSYRGFRSYCYYPAYRCYLCYDPITRQWYYWSDRLAQYRPLLVIASDPPLTNGMALLPTGVARGVPVAGALAPTGGAGLPALPPGATPIPAGANPAAPTMQ